MKQNYFSKKMTSKSNIDLHDILSSNSFTYEAKQAAICELNRRNIENDYQLPKEKKVNHNYPNDTSFIIKQSKAWRKYHENRLLLFGLICLASAIYLISPTIFTFKNSLVSIKGKINNVDVNINEVSSKSRMGYESKSRRATLYFSLIGFDKDFEIHENIGQDYRNEKYSDLKYRLKDSKNIEVWIKINELELDKPKVFQIDIDNHTFLTFNEVKTENNGIFIFLMIIGFFCVFIVLHRRYPNIFKNFIISKPTP